MEAAHGSGAAVSVDFLVIRLSLRTPACPQCLQSSRAGSNGFVSRWKQRWEVGVVLI